MHYRNIYEKSTIFLQNTLFDVFFIFLFFIFLKILIKCVFLRQYGTFFLHSRRPPADSPLPPTWILFSIVSMEKHSSKEEQQHYHDLSIETPQSITSSLLYIIFTEMYVGILSVNILSCSVCLVDHFLIYFYGLISMKSTFYASIFILLISQSIVSLSK